MSLYLLVNSCASFDVLDLADEAGLSLFTTLSLVEELHAAGFADRRSLRLTLSGLAVAASLIATANDPSATRHVVRRTAEIDEDGDVLFAAAELEACFGKLSLASA